MSEVAIWTCEFNGLDTQGTPEHLTVGDKFRMNCHGDIAVPWSADVPTVMMPKPEDDFTLAGAFRREVGSAVVQLTITGYRPGEHAPDTSASCRVTKASKSKSRSGRLNRSSSRAKSRPSPIRRKVLPACCPVLGVAALGAGRDFSIAGLVVGSRRWLARRRFRDTLVRHQTVLPRCGNSIKTRGFARRLNQATSASKSASSAVTSSATWRLFLMRQFEVPRSGASNAAIIKSVTTHRAKRERVPADDLRKVLRELTRANAPGRRDRRGRGSTHPDER